MGDDFLVSGVRQGGEGAAGTEASQSIPLVSAVSPVALIQSNQ